MTKRRFITQLPYVHQTDELRKFFSSTIDQVFQPGETQNINAFIGRKPAYFKAARDFYKTEIDAARTYYQLEPAMTTTASDNTFEDLLFYQDVANKLRFQGANVDNHSRLFNTDYYSWCPPVNVEKLDAFRDYYWLPDGPPIMVFDIPFTDAISDGIRLTYDLPAILPNLPATHLVVMVNDEVIVNDFTWDGNLDDGLILDGNINNGTVDGNVQLSFDIINGQVVFDEPVPEGDRVRVWVNGDFINYINGQASFTYPATASAYTYNTVTEQTTDSNGVLVTARVLKQYPETPLANPPELAPDMRIRIKDDAGDNLYQVTFVNGVIALVATQAPTEPSTTTLQYITIERGATNANGWSISNFWYHRDVLIYNDPTYQPSQASRPILEYFNTTQLLNYGAYMRKPVDFVLNDSSIDLMALTGEFRNAFTYPSNQYRDDDQEHEYNLLDAPLINGSYIKNGTRVLVTNSSNLESINQIITASIARDPAREWDISEFATTTNYDNALWDEVEMLSFDIEYRNPAIKEGTLNLDQVKVNPMTPATTAIAQIPSVLMPKELWFDGVVNAWKDITYYVGQEPLFNLFDRASTSLSTYLNTSFAGSKIFTYQRDPTAVLDPVLGLNVVRNVYGLIVFQDHLATDTWTYGINNASTYVGYSYFGVSHMAGDRAVLTYQNNWHVAGTTSQTVNSDGLYSIPTNLRANPLNNEIQYIASNDWKGQVIDLLAASNWNVSSDQFDLGAGSHIIQSRGTLLKTMLMCSDDNLDFIKAAIYNEHEYTRYRNKFVNLLKQYEVQNNLNDIEGSVQTLLMQLKSAKTNDFPFYNNGVIGDYFIPASGAYLGMSALWKPELILENGRTSSLVLIRGHDGSLIPGSSRFASTTASMTLDSNGQYQIVDDTNTQFSIDNKDLAMLTFENMIYTSCLDDLKQQRRPVFDIKSCQPGKYRTTEYTRDEYLAVARPIFERWVTKSGLKYRANTLYNEDNPFTWNYSMCVDTEGSLLPGFWRGIYQHYFDTDRPHTHPWEMLGFTSKPSWWSYSWTNTTRQSLIDALTVGLVVEPRGIPMSEYLPSEKDSLFARAGFARVNPVDSMGKLLDPIAANIVVWNNIVPFDQEWEFGDMAPVEYQWMTSPSYSFIISQLSYLMKPVKFVESNWETADEIEVYGYDWVSKKTGHRVQIKDYLIHNEIVNGVAQRVLGLQLWLSDFLRSTGKDVTISLGDRVRALGVNLAHKLGGFIDASSLKAFTENSGLIPQEDVKTLTYTSPSIREEFYGGVIVQWTGRGWKVLGYDVVNPAFMILPIDPSGAKFKITVEAEAASQLNDWHANTYYQVNQPVLYGNQTYRCIKTHTSAREFELQFWVIDNTIVRGDTNALLYYRDHLDTVERVTYGTEFYTKQDVSDFLSGYEAYLVSRGWDFSEYDQATNDVMDWKYAAQQFLSWSQVGWAPNTFIALSPVTNNVSFYSDHGTIENVEQLVNGVYSVLGKDGTAIEKRNISADRTDTGITVTVTNDKIFGLRLSVNEVEQAIVFHNKTIFNDVIYEPLFDVRQSRLRIITLLTTQWTGKLDAPGFIISNNQVLPSFEKQVEDIRNMYDIEKTINLPLRDNARHQIGYQNRTYLEELMYNDTNQFEFYQGMIQQKGAPGVFDKLLRNDELTQSRDLSFLEEWAFRTGEYGGTDIHSFFEMEFPKSSIQQSPQMVVLRQAASYWDLGDFDTEPTTPTGQCFEVGIPQNVDPVKLSSIDPDNTIVELYSVKDVYDSRIIMPYSDDAPFTAINRYTPEKNDLPTAGYARINEADWMALTISAFNSQVTAAPSDLQLGERVWIYDFSNSQWAMLRASMASTSTTSNTIMAIYPDASGVRVTLALNHNVVVGEQIYINKLINAVSDLGGMAQVIATTTEDSSLAANELIIEGSIISQFEYLVSDVQPEIIKLINMRVTANTLTNAALINQAFVTTASLVTAGLKQPQGGFTTNELVYVDMSSAISSKLPSNQQRWRVFAWNAVTGRFEKYRTQPQRVRSDLVRDVRVFDAESVRTSRTLNAYPLLTDSIFVYDPVKGLIPGVAQEEIGFKTEYDPANYNVGTGVQSSGFVWGEEQVGRLWWNINTTRFVEYASDDTLDDDARITTLYSQIDVYRGQIAAIMHANPTITKTALKVLTDPINALINAAINEIPTRQSEIDAELAYRRNNWGALAPNTTIDIYEWTRSDVPPSDWVTEVASGTNPDVYDGVVLNDTDPDWVESTIWNDQLGTYVPVYYFWVKDKQTIPLECDFRKISASSVASIITNPTSQGIYWAAPIATNAFIVAGLADALTDTSSIQFKVARIDSEVNRHVEWELMREGDERSVPTKALWGKLSQSLMGRNYLGDALPSTKRYVTDRVGYDVDHGQSLFSDVKTARKHLVQYLNNLFASIPVIDARRDTSVLQYTDMDDALLQWYQKTGSYYYEPLPDSHLYQGIFNTQFEFMNALVLNPNLVGLVNNMNQDDAFWTVLRGTGSITYDAQGSIVGDIGTIAMLWDIEVDTMSELNALVGSVNARTRVKLNGSLVTGNFATIWKLNANQTSFELITVQKYDSSDIFELTDWYASGYQASNPPLVTFATTTDRDNTLGTNPITSFVKVTNDGSGNWLWTQFVDGAWTIVAKHNATIQILDNVWENTGNTIDVTTTLPSNFASMVTNRDMGYELNIFLNSLREYILTDIEMNEMFFSMVSYAHTEQNSIDWCFKTSFMYVTGYTESLLQDPIAYVDRTGNLLDYINEVKPYHVKVRDFISKYGISDTANVHVTDFDFPLYYDPKLSKYRQLNPTVAADIQIIKGGIWSAWYDQYLNDGDQYVRKFNISMQPAPSKTQRAVQTTNGDPTNIEVARLAVSESVRLRVFRRGNVGAPITSAQYQTTNSLNIMLPNVMPHSSSMAVFADGLRVDPNKLTWNPSTSHVTTVASAVSAFEVLGFGYGATGVIRDTLYFRKTPAQSSFSLGYDNMDITIGQLLITVNGNMVAGSVNHGIVTIDSSVPDGLVQIAILDKPTDTFDLVTTARFGSNEIANKSLAQLYPALLDPTRAPLMNNFIVEIDGKRIAPEMSYKANLNSLNRVVRLGRDAMKSDLTAYFNGSLVTLGDDLVRIVTIPTNTRSIDLGQAVALEDMQVTDMMSNILIVGELHSDSINLDNPGVITSDMYSPANAQLLLAHGRLINIAPMTSNLEVRVKIAEFIPGNFTGYQWTPANAAFVKVNDLVVSVHGTDMGLLEVSDSIGQLSVRAPITSVYPNASVITITDLHSSKHMGSYTWTFNTDIETYYPISAIPATSSAAWVTLNGRRLINGIDYQIVRTGHPGWEQFVWDREGMDSDEYQLQGALAVQPVNVNMNTIVTYGIQLLVSTTPNDLLIATVFDAQQASHARVFELFIKSKVDQLFDTPKYDYEAWDHEEDYTVPREIALGDHYELVTDITNTQTQYSVRQAASPYTRDTIKVTDIEDKVWIDNEYVTIQNIVSGANAVLTGSRGANVTSNVAHSQVTAVLTPRIIGPENHYKSL